MAKFVRTSGTNNSGTNWDLHTLSSGKYIGAGIRRWDGNEYYYGLMQNGNRKLGVYHWGNGETSYGRFSDNKRNGVTLYAYAKDPNKITYYFGDWQNGLKHGRAFYIFNDGSWYYGTWKNDNKHGQIVYYNMSEGALYCRKYDNNNLISESKVPYNFYLPNSLRRPTLNGIHLPYSAMTYSYEHNANNDYEFNGTVSNGYWDGFACLEWRSSMFLGEYYRGKRGTGMYYYDSGRSYFGQLKSGNYEGFGTIFYEDNQFFFGYFVNGKKEGLGLHIYASGNALAINYRNGSAEGIGVGISSTDVITAQEYSNNKFIRYVYTYNGSTSNTTTPRTTTSTPRTTTSTPRTTTTSTRTTTPTPKTTTPKRKKTLVELGFKDPKKLYNSLVGLKNVKNIFDDVIDEVNNDNKKHNMVFIGNPGTGKSHLGNIYNGILYDTSLSSNTESEELDIEEALRSSNGKSIVSTAFNNAKNSVLIINNSPCLAAYSTFRRADIEAVREELFNNLKKSSNISIIFTCFASEENELNLIMGSFKENIDYTIKFDDLYEEDFRNIAIKEIEENGYTIEDEALDLIVDKIERNRRYRSFANAKDLLNLLDEAYKNCTKRCKEDYDPYDDEYGLIIEDDIFRIII